MKKIILLSLILFTLSVDSIAEKPLMIDFSAPGDVLADGNKIAAAGQPAETDLDALADSGFTTVIDLRGEGENRGYEEKAAVEARGMRYISLPVTGAEGVSFENARQLDAILESVEGPTLLHCGSGNRVGALLALRERLRGADSDQALAIGDRAGLTSLRPLVEKTLNEADVDSGSSAESEQ